jgi:hypothetical protein
VALRAPHRHPLTLSLHTRLDSTRLLGTTTLGGVYRGILKCGLMKHTILNRCGRQQGELKPLVLPLPSYSSVDDFFCFFGWARNCNFQNLRTQRVRGRRREGSEVAGDSPRHAWERLYAVTTCRPEDSGHPAPSSRSALERSTRPRTATGPLETID